MRKSFFLISLTFWGLNICSHAGQTLRFLPDKQNARTVILENDIVRYTFLLDKAVKLSSIVHKGIEQDLMCGNPALPMVSVRSPNGYVDVGYQLLSLEEGRDRDHVYFSIEQRSSYVDNPFIVKQTWSLGQGPELAWKVTVENTATGGRSHRQPRTMTANVTFPVIQKMCVGETDQCRYFLPTQDRFYKICPSSKALFYFTYDNGCGRIIDIFNPTKKAGLSFHVLDSVFDLNFEDLSDLKTKAFQTNLAPGENKPVINCTVHPHEGDWHEAVRLFKDSIRSDFDFSNYRRAIQDALSQLWVLNFTFLYGHDIYDPESNQFRIQSFLQDGETAFGGYNGLMLWHDYPRLGIDQRDQFDMYEDLPGGIEGLKDLVDQAHKKQVQVFIPYKPWDIIKGRKDHFQQVARIAKTLNADGIFLDTMKESDKMFREVVDQVSKDIVFLSEGRPDMVSAHLVNGSWNEKKNASDRMPVVDLYRFILPEHKVYNVRRADRKRTELIYNALFNGVGLIVWEDVFGEMNRFSWDERILINRYSRIVHEHSDALTTREPIPLIPTLHEDLYVNAYPISEKCVYVCYQHERETFDRKKSPVLVGPIMEVNCPENWHFVDVWNHREIPIQRKQDKSALIFPQETPDVMSCIVGMPKILDVQVDNDSLYVKTIKRVENYTIRINTINCLTFMEEEKISLAESQNNVPLSVLNLKYPYIVTVKLMQGNILKDEVVFNLK